MIPLGALMLDLASTSLTKDEEVLLTNPQVGGVILFARNYEHPEQLAQLTHSIKSISPNLLIAVDHEGGRVQRFRQGFSKIPAMASFESAYKVDPEQCLKECELVGWLLAAELLVHQIDISFTPVLDRNYHCSSVIGDRSFSENLDTITQLSSALMTGMHKAGMAATGKHFPGHGAVSEDSHLALPVDHRDLATILSQDVPPFDALIQAGLDAIMPAHIVFDQVDENPAGFSPVWIKEQLRTHLKFDGVVFSDDLNMEGAKEAGCFSERAKSALDAGCDMVLVCNNPGGAKEVLRYLESKHQPLSMRVCRMLGNNKSGADSFDKLKSTEFWQRAHAVLNKYND